MCSGEPLCGAFRAVRVVWPWCIRDNQPADAVVVLYRLGVGLYLAFRAGNFAAF